MEGAGKVWPAVAAEAVAGSRLPLPGEGLGWASGRPGCAEQQLLASPRLSAPSLLRGAPPRGAEGGREGGGRGAAMAEDPSALPWSINKDDYELQEVIGERRRRGGTGRLDPCPAFVGAAEGLVWGTPSLREVCVSAEGSGGVCPPSAEGGPVTHKECVPPAAMCLWGGREGGSRPPAPRGCVSPLREVGGVSVPPQLRGVLSHTRSV